MKNEEKITSNLLFVAEVSDCFWYLGSHQSENSLKYRYNIWVDYLPGYSNHWSWKYYDFKYID